MTLSEITKFIIGYYNVDPAKNEVALTMTAKWIAENIPAPRHNEVLQRVAEEFVPTSTNYFPKIAEFKAALVPAGGSEREANAAYALLERRSYIYKDAVVEDAAVQSGLDAIGGWQEFCNRTEDQNPWLRKAFVKAVIQARESGYQREPRVYRGLADRCEPVIIGNEERCRIAYQDYRMPMQQIENETHRAIAGAIAHLPAVEA